MTGNTQGQSPEEIKREILKSLEELDLETLRNLKGKRRVDPAEAAAADWTLTFWTVWRR